MSVAIGQLDAPPDARAVWTLVVERMRPIAAIAIGAALTGAATGTRAPLLGIWVPALLAFLVPWGRDRAHRMAARAGLSMFAVCILVGGLIAAYQTAMFGTNVDAEGLQEISLWYDLARQGFAVDPELSVNAPYALFVWRAAYAAAAEANLGDGIWIAIATNALLVALSAAVLVRISMMLFPEDWQRADRAGRLARWCAMFWLFGALWVRDSFALLMQVVVLAAFVSLLRRVTFRRLVTHGTVIAIVAVLTAGIRAEMLAAFPVLLLLAVLSVALQGHGIRRVALLAAGALVSLVVLFYSVNEVRSTITTAQASYVRALSSNGPTGISGLGYSLVVSQPLPVRLVTGFVYMHVFPIPVWTGFHFSSWGYHWLKSFSAIFMILVAPLAAVGFWHAMRDAAHGYSRTAPLTFVALYWPTMTAAVAVTSLETRHLGQFLPAFILLAVVPDLRQLRDRRAIYAVAFVWYSAVLCGHLLWMVVH